MMGAPVTPGRYGVSTIVRSSSKSFIAKVREICSWSSPRMLIAQTGLACICWCVRVVFSMQASTRVGSSESEVIELAVMPHAPSAVGIVMTVTPVAKLPMTRRKRPESIGMRPITGQRHVR